MQRENVLRPVTGAIAYAAAGNLARPAFSEAATLPCSSSAGPTGRNGDERRQLVTRAAKPYELRAARCSRREGLLRC